MPIRPLSSELQKKAEDELNEVPARIPQDIEYIREWLSKQPHIKARTDDQWLLSFLRGCKFSLERTKEKLDTFYTMRTLLPEFFSNRDPLQPEIQEILKLGICLPLPKTADPAAPRIVFVRNASHDPDKINIFNAIKTNLMIMDVMMLEDDHFGVAGHHVFQDLKGMTAKHMLQMTPSIAKKAMICFQQAYPARPKGIHFINLPSFFETMYNMMNVFLTEKMKKRVSIYSGKDYSDIYKIIPQSILPKEYGGDGDSLAELTAEWKKKVESYRDWFLSDAQYGSDEAKRPGKPKTAGDIFGVEGSFRKLNVD